MLRWNGKDYEPGKEKVFLANLSVFQTDPLPTYQQFSVKINPLWNLNSEGKGNYFFAKGVLGVQFYNIDISHGIY
jgi:hypothetical protein